MTFDDVKGLKEELLQPIQDKMRDLAASGESAEPLKREVRMAVGYSRRRPGASGNHSVTLNPRRVTRFPS
jgi:hypothetical protein